MAGSARLLFGLPLVSRFSSKEKLNDSLMFHGFINSFVLNSCVPYEFKKKDC